VSNDQTEQYDTGNGWVHVGNSDRVEIIAEPVIVHEGRYRLYKKPDGGIHIVYQRTDKDEPDHMELPGQLLRLAEMAGECKLSLPDMMREVMKLRGTM
jgi:hypothetical protein